MKRRRNVVIEACIARIGIENPAVVSAVEARINSVIFLALPIRTQSHQGKLNRQRTGAAQ